MSCCSFSPPSPFLKLCQICCELPSNCSSAVSVLFSGTTVWLWWLYAGWLEHEFCHLEMEIKNISQLGFSSIFYNQKHFVLPLLFSLISYISYLSHTHILSSASKCIHVFFLIYVIYIYVMIVCVKTVSLTLWGLVHWGSSCPSSWSGVCL